MADAKTIKIKCPVCNNSNCFETTTDEVLSYLCLSWGRTTNSYFTDGSEQLIAAIEKSPEIIKDLTYRDPDTNLVWMPSVVNIPSRGIIYPMGDKDNWNWAFSPIIEMSKKEQKDYPIPGKDDEYYESRLGVETGDGLKLFGQNEYVEACKEMGITKDIEEQLD